MKRKKSNFFFQFSYRFNFLPFGTATEQNRAEQNTHSSIAGTLNKPYQSTFYKYASVGAETRKNVPAVNMYKTMRMFPTNTMFFAMFSINISPSRWGNVAEVGNLPAVNEMFLSLSGLEKYF